jgi:hypothetical protein
MQCKRRFAARHAYLLTRAHFVRPTARFVRFQHAHRQRARRRTLEHEQVFVIANDRERRFTENVDSFDEPLRSSVTG